MRKMIIIGFLMSCMLYAGKFDVAGFAKKLTRSSTKEVAQVTKQLSKIPAAKRLVKSAVHSPLADAGIIKLCMIQPQYCLVTKFALEMARKSKFADELITKTKYPTDVVRQYAKHGDEYLGTMESFGTKTMSLSSDSYKGLKKKFPTMPNISFKTSKEFNDKMVQVLKYTGKKGWETSQDLMRLAKKYPRSTGVTAMMAWYVTDPESFLENKDKLVSQIGAVAKEGASDATKLTLGVTSGIADGFMEVVKEKMTVSNIVVLLLLMLSFAMWKMRPYVQRYVKAKFENSFGTTEKEEKRTKPHQEEKGLL